MNEDRWKKLDVWKLADDLAYKLHFSDRLGIIAKDEYENVKEDYEILGKMLWRFYKSINK